MRVNNYNWKRTTNANKKLGQDNEEERKETKIVSKRLELLEKISKENYIVVTCLEIVT